MMIFEIARAGFSLRQAPHLCVEQGRPCSRTTGVGVAGRVPPSAQLSTVRALRATQPRGEIGRFVQPSGPPPAYL
jgi:hypothetical protein